MATARMKVALFDTHGYDRESFTAANERVGLEITFVEPRLTSETFRDLSDKVLQDDVLARLLTFPNVVVTSHQAFLTHEALSNIATTTLANITAFERGEKLVNEVLAQQVIQG